MEYPSLSHAKEAHDTLNGQDGINALHVVEYDFATKKYHFVTL
jgi:hypothetical protein